MVWAFAKAFDPVTKQRSVVNDMGTLIRVIFREGTPRQKQRSGQGRRSRVARERGLTLWRERDDLVIVAAYRGAPTAETEKLTQAPPLKFAPLA